MLLELLSLNSYFIEVYISIADLAVHFIAIEIFNLFHDFDVILYLLFLVDFRYLRFIFSLIQECIIYNGRMNIGFIFFTFREYKIYNGMLIIVLLSS